MANGGDRFLHRRLAIARLYCAYLQFHTSFTSCLLTQPAARSHNNNNNLQLALRRIYARCGSAYPVHLQGDFYCSLLAHLFASCIEHIIESTLMKKIVSIVLIAIVWLTVTPPAIAASAEVIAQGGKIFSANCAACHMNGNNVVDASKNLKAETLHTYNMDSIAAIVTQVTNGKNAMPSFKSRLNEDQIQAVAAYVLDQAEHGW